MYITHIDLCRFTSLRTKVVICSIIAVSVYGMYYSPVLAANSIGLDIYSISFIVLGSDFLVYFPTLLMIQKIKRRYFGISLLSLAVLCSVILFYVGESGTCGFCLENSLQIVFLVIFRASVSYYFSFFWIYISEIFPARVRGLSFGITSAFGSISSVVTPAILTNLFNDGVDGVFLFAVTGIIAAGGLILLP